LDDNREDQITWTLESSGEYSAKSAYNIQFAGQIITDFGNLIWSAWAPPKCKFFLWLLIQDKLWTAARLQLRGWTNNYFCALCERNLETAMHLFSECPYSITVWTLVAEWSQCCSLHPSQWRKELDIEDWFSHLLQRKSRMAHTLAILTAWSIWKQRNDTVFREVRKTAPELFEDIRDTCFTWSNARGKCLKPLTVARNPSV
jgi:hypothetical protein